MDWVTNSQWACSLHFRDIGFSVSAGQIQRSDCSVSFFEESSSQCSTSFTFFAIWALHSHVRWMLLVHSLPSTAVLLTTKLKSSSKNVRLNLSCLTITCAYFTRTEKGRGHGQRGLFIDLPKHLTLPTENIKFRCLRDAVDFVNS